jgi:hypothetical protein
MQHVRAVKAAEIVSGDSERMDCPAASERP